MEASAATFLTVLLIVATVTCVDKSLDLRWEKFKTEHKKIYNEDVEIYRRGIWEATIREIEEHNKRADNDEHSYYMRETKWDDLTYQEFMHGNTDVNSINRVKRASMNGTGDCFNEKVWNDASPYGFNSTKGLPANVDWAEKGYVTSVKHQRKCGSCWAFAAVGAIEGQWYKKTKTLVSLSPQCLVDCSPNNEGCNGGLPSRAFKDVISGEGISSAASYPYGAKKGTCELSSRGVNAKIKGYRTINSEKELLNAVAYVGPVAVGIQTGDRIRNVGKGVFTDCTGEINHAVLVVGYGKHEGKKVWKIKNSWSDKWGNNGYFYLTRDVVNACGITQHASYPTVDDVTRGPVTSGQVPTLGQTVGDGVRHQTSITGLLLSLCLVLCLV